MIQEKLLVTIQGRMPLAVMAFARSGAPAERCCRGGRFRIVQVEAGYRDHSAGYVDTGP